MPRVQVTLTNRYAYIEAPNKLVHEQLSGYWAFSAPGAIYTRAHKLWIRERKRAIEDGEPDRKVVGWDGKIRVFQRGKVPAGVFRATWRDAQEALSLKFRIVRDRPKPKPFLKGFDSDDAKYHYQNQCVEAMKANVRRGGGIILAATASGKTKIFAQFASKVVYSCLFVVDQTDLLYQSQKEIAMWLKEKVGIVGDSEYVIQRVTVATIQTLQYHLADPVFLAWFKKIKIIVVDELHKAMAKRTFALFEVVRPIARFGLTATLQLKKKPVRFKAWAFAGPVIFEFPLLQGQKLGVLAKGHAVQLLFPEVHPTLSSKRMSEEPLEVEVLTNEEKMRTCARLARYLIGRGRYVIVLVDRIAHIKAVHKAHSHITHRIAYGATKRKRRVAARKKFEQGDIRCIIASRIFTQAINIKRVDAIFDLAEKRDLNDPIQKFGRGIRLHKDKKFLLYVDFGTQTGKFNKYAKGRAREMKAAGIEVKKFKVNDGDDAIAVIKKTMTRLEKLYDTLGQAQIARMPRRNLSK